MARQSQLRRNLRTILLEGMAMGVMVGVGETYLAAFALALGYSDVATGLLASLPLLGGAALQLVSPAAIGRLRSNRRWVLICAGLQAASLLLFSAGALRGHLAVAAFAASCTLYWATGLATGPAWTVWVERLIPARLRLRFLARRSLASQLTVLGGLLLGGALLHLGAARGSALRMFALVFGVAMASRLLSVLLLARQPEPAVDLPDAALPGTTPSAKELLRYMVLIQFAVNLAGPYFNPYMLRRLELSYAAYTLIGAVIFVARIATLHLVEQHGRQLRAHRLLWVGGLSIVPMAALWIVSDALGYLVAIQIAAGVAWALYELATLLLFFEAIPPAQRAGVLTQFNLANSTALVAGSSVGGLLLRTLGTSRRAYHVLFGLSSAGRAMALVALRRVPDARQVTVAPVPTRTLSVRTVPGGIHRPIVSALPAPEERVERGGPGR